MKIKRQVLKNQFLALAIGLVYLWFGGLKFFDHLSPAEDLAKNTMDVITMGLVPSNLSIILLAIWETTIGILLVLNIFRKPVVLSALLHMCCTFLPFFIFPNQSFSGSPIVFTLLGQYIFKNIIIVAALLTLYKNTIFTE
ncbi:doxx family protein [Aestuariibaculum sp. TT11]|uniref:Doxx family protein n=1 Tax=Aestuariibaculum sediminum TaxID=2770637 RepID=A0A8J6U858_9FLAO|nr:doxx family protein [Aestuariibaculum sediminum]